MFNSSLEILLSPIIITQGIYVKKTILRLNEPMGNRKGITGQGKLLNLLITGDSAAAGVGADKQLDALSGQLIQNLKNDFRCTWTLHAKTGFTTSDLIKHLNIIPAEKFDIVVVSIGVNDVTKISSINQWKNEIQILHNIFIEKFNAKYIIYTELPPLEKFPALPNPLRYFLSKTAKKMNKELNILFNNKKFSTVLNINLPFNTNFIAKDNFHPSPDAYKIWAQYTAEKIFKYANQNLNI
ncbi:MULTISPECIES: SGNH/GDSL hydrolase family protein [unclassified Acinetobacter]|uniref:SGNH/GDSL hydrolase family protein n=1 Tax=unclassified Acinetobacter TaxID=196816 RepID=UPI002934DBA3|nr:MULTISPECIES: SGNH/GDSL hydrolase family protein [unclassified Acinetobacter]WOE33254.1 SGNH/GDSL hydrolase family protein [Acinetobacter sp. SAAs470]WOE36965.1 SGNH/GDSL hydrolase family protein [Acinetobacter sp. SAAs474]